MLFNQSVKQIYDDPLSAVFAALADPTRRSILQRLTHGSATVNELAQPYDMSLPAVSKHLKILEEAGLISQTRVAQTRPRQLELVRLNEAATWLEDYRRMCDF